MESTDSSMGSPHQPHLPPGFRFHPTDEELVVHYLKKKASSVPLPVTIIAEVNLYKFDPWELPAKATFGEQEWYFFSPRDRKYPNGARPNRAATSGYWKATGTDKPVLTSGGTQKVGVKKALVFYRGKPPKGVKTSWIMHEYRLADNKPTSCRPTGCDPKRGSLRLDDWVLCRIYKKNSSPLRGMEQDREDSAEEMIIGGSALLNSVTVGQQSPKLPQPKPGAHHFVAMHETQQLQLQQQQHDDDDDHNNNNSNLLDGIMGGDAIAYSATTSVSMQSLFPVAPPATFPIKRTFLSSLYWNDGGCSASTAATATSSDNRFHADCASGGGVGEGSSSFTALLGQAPPLHQETMLGALSGGDGGGPYRHTYQLPGMNWFP